MSQHPLLQIQDLSIGFDSPSGPVEITDRVCLEITGGEIFGLVGESGCGKTVTALSILRLLPNPGGRVLGGTISFEGRDVLTLPAEELRALRGAGIAMIFQEPAAAMNPLYTIRRQLEEVFEFHPFEGDPQQRIAELLARVGFADPARVLGAYPHQLSGGMLQRVMIAMALLLRPRLLIADEPTTALDVTVQAQIMELLKELQRENKMSVLLITHNLGLIAQYADRVAVMYAGRVVEQAPVDAFLAMPLHPYSQGLIGALPESAGSGALRAIEGQVPRPEQYPGGCRFQPRCAQAFDACQARPALRALPDSATHHVACFFVQPDAEFRR
ncbi:MAG: ABC transporter ATP-binding protein [Leptospirales bacterium]|nr:ABC transporter ATP-binding protein [Leptospirales bacterium]